MRNQVHICHVNHILLQKMKRVLFVGRLIIDGNSFFEIDEECIKKKRISKKCGLDKYLKEKTIDKKIFKKGIENETKKGDG